MNVLKVLGIVRKVLTKITDFLLIGRENGWWDKRSQPAEPKQPQDYI